MSEVLTAIEPQTRRQSTQLIFGYHTFSTGEWSLPMIEKINNSNPDTFAMDGTSIWVVNNTSAEKLNKYFFNLFPQRQSISVVGADIATLIPENIIMSDQQARILEEKQAIETLRTSAVKNLDTPIFIGIGVILQLIAAKQKESINRRRFLKLGGYASIGIGLSKVASVLGVNLTSNPEVDNLAREIYNLVPNPINLTTNIDWFTTGRTAMVVQKTLEHQQLSHSGQATIAFGTAHISDANKIMDNEEFRLQKISQFAKNLLPITEQILLRLGKPSLQAQHITQAYIEQLSDYGVIHLSRFDAANRSVTNYTSDKIKKAIQ